MNPTKSIRLATLLVVAASMLLLGAGESPEARFGKIGHNLMCMCGCGQVLLECNHVGCTYSDRMRDELTAGIQRGDNDNLIEQSFVQKYGNTVLAAPTTTGFNRVAWIMPFVIFTLAMAAVIVVVRTWKMRAAPAMAAGAPGLSPNELASFRERAHKETEL